MNKYDNDMQIKFDPAIAKRLREFRIKYVDKNQGKAAKILQRSHSQLSYAERGMRQVPIIFVKILQNDYKLNPDWLLNGDGPMKLTDTKKKNTIINVAEMNSRIDSMEVQMKLYASSLRQAWKTIEIQGKQIDIMIKELNSRK